MKILRRERRVQGNEITFRQQRVERDEPDAGFPGSGRRMRIVRQHAHVEAASPAGDGAADTAATDDAECFIGDIIAQQGLPFALSDNQFMDGLRLTRSRSLTHKS